MGGMLAATFLAIFFVPLFYVLIRKLTQHRAEPVAALSQPMMPPLSVEEKPS